MNRRELIKNIALISGGLFIGSNFLLTGCKNQEAGTLLLDSDLQKLLGEVAETIIPETTTAGAKSANVPQFINKVFQDIYTEEEQTSFINSLRMIDDKAKEKMGDNFANLSADKKAELFNQIKNPKDQGFLAMYQMILYGYLTSEKGMKSTFRYTPVPGNYVGDIPYKKGDKMFVGLNG
jgi:Gluconate 2-dehydrogenase subunit 3